MNWRLFLSWLFLTGLWIFAGNVMAWVMGMDLGVALGAFAISLIALVFVREQRKEGDG